MMTPKDESKAEKKFRDNFENIYLSYYTGMVRFAKEFVSSKEDAEDIVQDAFADVWNLRKGYLHTMNYMLAFLFTSIKNKCIDLLRHQIVVREVENKLQEEFRLDMQMKIDSLEIFDQDTLASEEYIDERLAKALQGLPEGCREIVTKNKIEGIRQTQIAEDLNISIHTVEAQMVIGMKKLKDELKDCFPLFLFLLYL
jgi:RNA polymerase sigma-70 factor (ECF subfamily)